MQPKIINPYPFVGEKHKEALDFIIANLPANPEFDQLNEILVAAIFPDDPANPVTSSIIGISLRTVLPNAYNGYVNGSQMTVNGSQLTADNVEMASAIRHLSSSNTRYSEKQLHIINYMLDGIHRVPVESIKEFMESAGEKIVSSGLTFEEEAPLIMAAASAISDHEYWMAQLANPGSASWVVYLNTDPAINYMHVAGWVEAAFQGALLSYGMIKPPQIQFADMLSSMVGSVGLAAGKVVFGWYGGC